MNSLNILSARVSPPQTPVPTRRNSYGYGEALGAKASHESRRSASISGPRDDRNETPTPERDVTPSDEASSIYDEKVPLLVNGKGSERESSAWYTAPYSFANAIWGSIRWLLSILAAPCVYLMAFMYNEKGVFSPFSQLYKLFTWGNSGQSSRPQAKSQGPSRSDSRSSTNEKLSNKGSRRLRSSNSSSSGLSSESESDRGGVNSETSSLEVPSRHTRSRSAQTSDEIAPARRSIRIKLHNEDSLRQRKHRKSQSTSSQSNGKGGADSQLISPATLKSPTSPASSLLRDKYPRAPAPPRPLIPRRQPSYSTVQDFENGRMAQKTLILDLDETLIHSMAKGGRMSTGHMVEVKLNTYVGTGGTSLGPQHPILYYVHKRPHCDDFLRRICKWYNLVVFTASVQEYADPVIDWLEQERKFFSGRYYRQHCTYRHGAFIKDLTHVEPDLSKVMILDNSPLSYMFHQDNAIPIEGWINDPTDNDLLHLVPMLEGLQYVTDVRAFLALRGGEDGKHMTS